jgi:hypothetical protein
MLFHRWISQATSLAHELAHGFPETIASLARHLHIIHAPPRVTHPSHLPYAPIGQLASLRHEQQRQPRSPRVVTPAAHLTHWDEHVLPRVSEAVPPAVSRTEWGKHVLPQVSEASPPAVSRTEWDEQVPAQLPDDLPRAMDLTKAEEDEWPSPPISAFASHLRRDRLLPQLGDDHSALVSTPPGPLTANMVCFGTKKMI